MLFLVCLGLAKYPSTICYRLLHFLTDINQLLTLQPEVSCSLRQPHLSLYSFVLLNLILSSVTEMLYPSFFSFFLFFFPHPSTRFPLSMASFMAFFQSLSNLSQSVPWPPCHFSFNKSGYTFFQSTHGDHLQHQINNFFKGFHAFCLPGFSLFFAHLECASQKQKILIISLL